MLPNSHQWRLAVLDPKSVMCRWTSRRVRVGAVIAAGLLVSAVWFAAIHTAATAHALQSADAESGDPSSPDKDQDPWHSLPDLGGMIAIAVTIAVTGWSTAALKPSVTVGRSGTRAKPSGRTRPLLQPCARFDVSQIEQTGRIPIEPCIDDEGRVGLLRRFIISLLWPSFAKPAFLLTTWHKADGPAVRAESDGLPSAATDYCFVFPTASIALTSEPRSRHRS